MPDNLKNSAGRALRTFKAFTKPNSQDLHYHLGMETTYCEASLLKKLLSKYGNPHEIVTDKLRSYRAVLREIGYSGTHETGQYKNNQCETSQSIVCRLAEFMCRIGLACATFRDELELV